MARSENIEVGNDAEQAILTRLMADTVLQGLVEGQIYPSHLSELPQDDIDFPAITFRQAGSPVADHQETVFPQLYQFNCWSKRSYNEAMRIRGALKVALNNQRLSAGNSVIRVKFQNYGQNVLDPTASLYYVTSQFRIVTIDVSTPV